MVTWVQLQDKYSDSTLFVFNTHFDHVGVKARELSAHLLVQAVDSLAGDQPVIITGDFNSSDKDAPHEVITGAGFKDSRVVSATDPVGPVYTWTGFEVGGKTGERIDFIFVRNTQPVLNHVVHDDSSGGHYLSDHLPVIVRF
jgi:endonuclease/exonuclease/phosphatase family metal-dependent hydrolase